MPSLNLIERIYEYLVEFIIFEITLKSTTKYRLVCGWALVVSERVKNQCESSNCRSSALPDFNRCIDTASRRHFTFHIEATDEMIMCIVYFSVASTSLKVPNSNRLIVSSTY